MKKLLASLKLIRTSVIAILLFNLVGCMGMPAGAIAVTDFDLQQYLGTWYEIARLDHSFERGLSNVQARYSMRDDGGVRVINRGYKDGEQEWSEAEGKAYFVDGPNTAKLKVSFFGPFYGAYNVIDLDEQNYQYALVVGNSTKYMWILARNPQLDAQTLERLLDKAAKLGIATNELIYPEHNAAGE